jgi:RNA polymerase primary sigma factor
MPDSAFLHSLGDYLKSRNVGPGAGYLHNLPARPVISRAYDTVGASAHGNPVRRLSHNTLPAFKDFASQLNLDDIEAPPPDIIDAEFEVLRSEEPEKPEYEISSEAESSQELGIDGKKPVLDGLFLFFRDIGRNQLLTRNQEILYGRQIQEYSPQFSRSVLTPGYGSMIITRLLYQYLTDPRSESLMKLPDFGRTKSYVLSRGSKTMEAVRESLRGERAIIQRLITENLCPRSRERLLNDLEQLQHTSTEVVLPLEPKLGRLNGIYRDLMIYAKRIEALNTELRTDGGSEKSLPFLIEVAGEAGYAPDRFPDYMADVSEQRNALLGARDSMAIGNLRLVVSIAKQYRGCGIRFEDLIGYGTTGLMRGVDKYRPELGYKFSTYSWWWIKQAITRALQEQGRSIKLPAKVLETGRRIWHARNKIVGERLREPTIEEIAEITGLSPDLVKKYEKLPSLFSYDRPIIHGGEDEHVDFMRADVSDPFDDAERSFFADDIDRQLGRLKPIDADIIRRRYGLPPYETTYTLEQCSRVYNVTRERIRQREEKALEKLGHKTRLGKYRPLFEKVKTNASQTESD